MSFVFYSSNLPNSLKLLKTKSSKKVHASQCPGHDRGNYGNLEQIPGQVSRTPLDPITIPLYPIVSTSTFLQLTPCHRRPSSRLHFPVHTAGVLTWPSSLTWNGNNREGWSFQDSFNRKPALPPLPPFPTTAAGIWWGTILDHRDKGNIPGNAELQDGSNPGPWTTFWSTTANLWCVMWRNELVSWPGPVCFGVSVTAA